MVRRLDFSVPEFVRVIWTSDEAKSVWQPRVSAVSNMYQKLELEAVRAGIRSAVLQSYNPDEFMTLSRQVLGHGLFAVPLTQEKATSSYSNASQPLIPGEPWTYRVAIGDINSVEKLSNAWKSQDDELIGDVLGYPECCRIFFHRYWNREGYRDTTYPMILDAGLGDKNHIEVNGPVSCNILLRWLGVRLVSHLPCRFSCAATHMIGDRMRLLAEHTFPREAEWLNEMLNWPVRWSSLHGIAIITNPVCRIVTSSDAFAERIIIDKFGPHYPDEGAVGLEFPFQKIQQVRMKKKKEESVWKDNGFDTEDSMNRAHDTVINAIDPIPVISKVLDLGCGNGLLASKICKRYLCQASGVESNRSKKPISQDVIISYGDVQDTTLWNPPYDLILISLNRFAEMREEHFKQFIGAIFKSTKYLLVYTYDRKAFENPDGFNLVTMTRNDQVVVYLLKPNEDKRDTH